MRFSQEPLDALSLRLSAQKRTLFCASCVQKLATEMREFLTIFRGDEIAKKHCDCIMLLWDIVLQERVSGMDLARLRDYYDSFHDSLSPEEETFLCEGAIEFCSSLYHTIQCIDGSDHRVVFKVASCVINELENFLILVNDVQPEYHAVQRPVSFSDAREESNSFIDFIYGLPLMKAEIRHQIELLEEIASVDELTADYVEKIRRTSAELGVQPIKRGLISTPLEDSEGG